MPGSTRRATPLVASAHCDLPCGVYDPAQARIEAQSVKGIMEKYNASTDDAFKTRALFIKEERCDLVKHHLWVLVDRLLQDRAPQGVPEPERPLLDGDQDRRRSEEDHRRRGRRSSARRNRRHRRNLLGHQEVRPLDSETPATSAGVSSFSSSIIRRQSGHRRSREQGRPPEGFGRSVTRTPRTCDMCLGASARAHDRRESVWSRLTSGFHCLRSRDSI